jgi:hypothetical protein
VVLDPPLLNREITTRVEGITSEFGAVEAGVQWNGGQTACSSPPEALSPDLAGRWLSPNGGKRKGCWQLRPSLSVSLHLLHDPHAFLTHPHTCLKPQSVHPGMPSCRDGAESNFWALTGLHV